MMIISNNLKENGKGKPTNQTSICIVNIDPIAGGFGIVLHTATGSNFETKFTMRPGSPEIILVNSTLGLSDFADLHSINM